MYWMPKVFFMGHMPDDVRDVFYKHLGSYDLEQTYIDWYVHEGSLKPMEDYCGREILSKCIDDDSHSLPEPCNDDEYVIERGDDIVSDWLFDNGAKIGERVIIYQYIKIK